MSDPVLHIGINSASLEDPRPVIENKRDEIYKIARELEKAIMELTDDNSDDENIGLLEQACHECLDDLKKLQGKIKVQILKPVKQDKILKNAVIKCSKELIKILGIQLKKLGF